MQGLLGFFSCYFLKNEAMQMKIDGLYYFVNFWNYIDVVTPMFILTLLCINALDIDLDPEVERSI